MTRQFAVFGLGIFGSNVALSLFKRGYTVLGVDIREEPVKDMAGKITEVVQADTTDEKVLEALGIKNFDVAIVSIGDDIQSNILTTLALKELGLSRVIARAINGLHGKILEKIGADQVIFPERDMALRLAGTLAIPHAMRSEELFPDHKLVESRVPSSVIGMSLGKAQLRNKMNITVVAIKRGDEYIVPPSATDVFQKEDIVFLVGNEKHISRFLRNVPNGLAVHFS